MIECPLARSARLWPNRPALIAGDRSWSYQELDEKVRCAEGFLRAQGLEPPQPIAAIAENDPDLVVLIHASARLGVPLALLHPRLTPLELEQQLARIQPSVRFASAGLALPFETWPLSTVSSGIPPPQGAVPKLDPTRVQSILFTSGSSGPAKAVALTVGNHRASALASARNLGGDPEQCWLACLPLCHVGGLAIVVRAATYGAALSLVSYDTDTVARTLAEGSTTHVSLVPTMLGRLLDQGALPGPQALRAILVGGAPSDEALWTRAHALDLPVLRTYGLTETSSQVTAERPGEFSGTCGRPLDGTQVRIVDEERRELPVGTMGEIEVSGPSVMQGYLGDPRATRKALPDRWLRTRDLGSLDPQGRLSVAARRADLILSGGENVAPAEVESVLSSHPQIAEAAVVAIPHADLGQVPLAVLVARGDPPSEEALRAWCRSHLAAFKCPRRWVFVKALPRSALGKVDRTALRNAVMGELV
jgi:O-succinylbenzoic acid--CoA ligase